MASIARRPDGRWRPRYRDEAGKEHSRHFDRKSDAQRWLDEVTASVVIGDYVDPDAGKITFRAWFDQWSSRQVWERGTMLAAQQAAASVTFADVPMRHIRPSHVQQWIKAMSRPASTRKSGLARRAPSAPVTTTSTSPCARPFSTASSRPIPRLEWHFPGPARPQPP